MLACWCIGCFVTGARHCRANALLPSLNIEPTRQNGVVPVWLERGGVLTLVYTAAAVTGLTVDESVGQCAQITVRDTEFGMRFQLSDTGWAGDIDLGNSGANNVNADKQ